MRAFTAFAIVLLAASAASAQSADAVTTPPPNIVLNNYDSVPVGPFGGLEGSAYVARVGDPSAAWFNPAGLARQDTAQISGSAGVYERTSVAPTSFQNTGGSIQQLPNFVGFTVTPRKGYTFGAALVTTNAWVQETDGQVVTTIPAGPERFAYSADSDFEQRVLAISVGYRGSGPWRYGGGFAFSLMNLRLVQSASDRIATATALQSLLIATRVGGSALQMRLQGGVQYDRSHWQFGGAFRTPGATLMKSANITLDGTADSGPSSVGASVFDADAHMEYHLPWEFQGGAAYVGDRLAVEVDLQAYTPVSAYAMVSTDQPSVVYRDTGNGGPPSVVTSPFPGLTTESNGVVNVGVGGHYLVSKNRTLRIHGGIGSNQSPVGDADTLFNKVDLLSWTLGVSGSLGKFQFSAGVNSKSGTSSDITLRNLLNGQVVHTPVDVKSIGFIYALAYQF
ncbi:MAG TPA: hypothetical protein VH583_04840 [Vicinamibacterales bacterium]